MIKWEIILWLLLTLILLLSPVVFLIKNYDFLSETRKAKRKKYLTTVQSTSSVTWNNLKSSFPSFEKIEEEVHTPWASEEKIIPPLAKEIVETPWEQEKKNKAVKKQRQKKVEKTQEQLIQEQKVKEKNQKKIHEIKMSAITFKERGKLDEYEKKLIEWLALDSDNHEFQEKLSDYYFDQWNYVKAQSILKKIVNRNPANHKAIWQIWQVYYHQKDLDTAKILIEKAISVKSDNPKYYISLVDINYTKWNLKDAIKNMEKVLKLRPSKIEYLLGIATLHEENGEPNKARAYYSKIIEIDPLHTQAKDGLERLA